MEHTLSVRLVRTCSLPNAEGLYSYRVLDPALNLGQYSNIRDGVLWDPARLGLFHQPFHAVCQQQVGATSTILKLPAPCGKKR